MHALRAQLTRRQKCQNAKQSQFSIIVLSYSSTCIIMPIRIEWEAARMITFDTHPDRYKHWKLQVDGPIVTLVLDVAEDGGIRPGYKLKLNSYDLGVDIELHDALNRIRFEHPQLKAVVLTSGKERMFCAGANIYMLGSSPHAWKVNFCKFTNQTRNAIAESSRNSALN